MNTHISRFLFGATIGGALALLLLIGLRPTPVHAAPTIAFYFRVSVTTQTDEYDVVANSTCSLREAIKSQNDNAPFGGCYRTFVSGSGTDTVLLPSGTYTLTRSGSGENLDTTGDLDIRTSMVIIGTSPAIVTGGPSWTDRIFHVLTGTVTIKDIEISGGSVSSDYGGAVLIQPGAFLTLNDSSVNGNSASSGGGGILNNGTLTLNNVTISGNSGPGGGGGIFNVGTLTLNNVTISGNSTNGQGGGIYNDSGNLTLNNVTISGNNTVADGGGIWNKSGTAMLTNVTLSANSALSGGGIFNDTSYQTGPVTLTMVILSGNSGGNCIGPIGSSDADLSSDSTCGFVAGRSNVNARLAPLGNYGGSTLTQIPLGGSPALNNGDILACPATDQRGKPRPAGVGCDVGAVERQLIDFPFVYLPLVEK